MSIASENVVGAKSPVISAKEVSGCAPPAGVYVAVNTHLEAAIPYYRGRLLMRPGVTGLAQVQLPPDTDLESVRTKLAYDVYYVSHLGLWLDIRIGCAAILKMLSLPFATICWLSGFPSRAVVHTEYQKRL